MSTLLRQLIAFDILKQELEEVKVHEYESAESDWLFPEHLQLLSQCLAANKQILASISDMSEFDFAHHLEQIDLDFKVPTKQLLIIHHKLLGWAIDFVKAKIKVNAITAEDFSEQAEVRLDLWQTKAAKAKNQIKTLAQALGAQGYSDFVDLYRLNHTELARLFIR